MPLPVPFPVLFVVVSCEGDTEADLEAREGIDKLFGNDARGGREWLLLRWGLARRREGDGRGDGRGGGWPPAPEGGGGGEGRLPLKHPRGELLETRLAAVGEGMGDRGNRCAARKCE